MSRLVYLPLSVIGLAALVVVYRLAEPSHLYVEADNRDILQGMATNQAAELTASAPTTTPYVSPTPTRTPRPATETPLPTWYPDASPGVRMVPRWTETPPVVDEIDVGLPACSTVTPMPYVDTACEVRT